MAEIDEQRRRQELHSKLDADVDGEIRRLEEWRKQGHAWIDGIPASFLSFIVAGSYESHLTSQIKREKTPASSSGSSASTQYRFPYKEAIKAIIQEFGFDADISTPPIYEELKRRYDEIRNNPKPVHVKAMIASALNRLKEEGYLKLHKQGGGSIPHSYRRIRPEASQEVTEQGGSVEVDLKEEDLLARADV